MISLSYFVLSFSGKVDSNFASYPEWFIKSLIDDRKNLFVNDLIRGGIFIIILIILSFGIIYSKISKTLFGICLVSTMLVDHFINNSSILKNDSVCEVFGDCSFKRVKDLEITMSEADQFILENNTERKRVYNLQNTFNDARTSYYHSSIGGYHGAKMRRYQDVIENIFPEERNNLVSELRENSTNFSENHLLNMLNVGFIQFGDKKNNVVKNNYSNGNAWFINKILEVNSAEEEMELMSSINSKREAIVDISRFELGNNREYNIDGKISVVEHSPKRLLYKSSNSFDGFIVFSEIYYPDGWKVYVNDVEKKLVRTNYILRGIEVDKGENTIEMVFNPNSYIIGDKIIKASNYILLLLIIICCIIEFRKKNDK